VYCPFCANSASRVVDSRLASASIRRRRECSACGERFTTYERHDQGPLYIRKRDGSRQEFDRAKLLAGLERAAIKRPIERGQLEAIVDRIVAELRARGGTPEAAEVGELALLFLRGLDPVAYVRFASVYKKFADVAEFESELERIERELPVQASSLFDGGAVRIESQAAKFTPKTGLRPKSGRS
jgi:transcriptional repressor NrdR